MGILPLEFLALGKRRVVTVKSNSIAHLEAPVGSHLRAELHYIALRGAVDGSRRVYLENRTQSLLSSKQFHENL
jgi:hypothetical protein